jgi:hypothetical protein
MNNELKVCGRKQSWPIVRYCPGICLEGLRKTAVRVVDVVTGVWTGHLLVRRVCACADP